MFAIFSLYLYIYIYFFLYFSQVCAQVGNWYSRQCKQINKTQFPSQTKFLRASKLIFVTVGQEGHETEKSKGAIHTSQADMTNDSRMPGMFRQCLKEVYRKQESAPMVEDIASLITGPLKAHKLSRTLQVQSRPQERFKFFCQFCTNGQKYFRLRTCWKHIKNLMVNFFEHNDSK